MPSPRFRPSPNEEATMSKKDFDERRKARLLQVRKQESEIAANVRSRFQRRLSVEHEQLAAQLQSEWDEYQLTQKHILKERQELATRQIGEAHRNAASEVVVPHSKTAQGKEEARQKAEARHVLAMKRHAEDEEHLRRLQNQHIESRSNAVMMEKERAKHVASRPVKANTELTDLLSCSQGVRSGSIQSTKAPLEPTYHHLNAHASPAMAVAGTAMVEAVDVENQRQSAQQERDQVSHERQEVARLRHRHAMQHVRLRQDYEQQLRELEALRQADNQRRKRQLESVPKNLFVAPFIQVEQRQVEEEQLERHVEAMCFNQPLNSNAAVSSASSTVATETKAEAVSLPSGSTTELSVSSLTSTSLEFGDGNESPAKTEAAAFPASNVQVHATTASSAQPLSAGRQSQPLHRLLEHVRTQQQRSHQHSSADHPVPSVTLSTGSSHAPPMPSVLHVSDAGRQSQPYMSSVQAASISAPTSSTPATLDGLHMPPAPVTLSSSTVQPLSPAALCQNCSSKASSTVPISCSTSTDHVAAVRSANTGGVPHPVSNAIDRPAGGRSSPDISALSLSSLQSAGSTAYVVVTTPSILTVHSLSASTSSVSSSVASTNVLIPGGEGSARSLPPSTAVPLPSGGQPPVALTQTITSTTSGLSVTAPLQGMVHHSTSVNQVTESSSATTEGARESGGISASAATTSLQGTARSSVTSEQTVTSSASNIGASESPSTQQLVLPGWEATQSQLAQYRQSQQELLEQFNANMLQLQRQQVSLSQMMLNSSSLQSSPSSLLSVSHSPSTSQFLTPSPTIGGLRPHSSPARSDGSFSQSPRVIDGVMSSSSTTALSSGISVSALLAKESVASSKRQADLLLEVHQSTVAGHPTAADVDLSSSMAGDYPNSHSQDTLMSNSSSQARTSTNSSVLDTSYLADQPPKTSVSSSSSGTPSHVSSSTVPGSGGLPLSVAASTLHLDTERLLAGLPRRHHDKELASSDSGEDGLLAYTVENPEPVSSLGGHVQVSPGLSVIVEEPSVLLSSSASSLSSSSCTYDDSKTEEVNSHQPDPPHSSSLQPSFQPTAPSGKVTSSDYAADGETRQEVVTAPRPYETQLANLLERLQRIQQTSETSSSTSLSETKDKRSSPSEFQLGAKLPPRSQLHQTSSGASSAASSLLMPPTASAASRTSSNTVNGPTGHLLSDLSTVSSSDLDLEVNNLSSSIDSLVPGKSEPLKGHLSSEDVRLPLATSMATKSTTSKPLAGRPLGTCPPVDLNLGEQAAGLSSTASSPIPLALVRPSTHTAAPRDVPKAVVTEHRVAFAAVDIPRSWPGTDPPASTQKEASVAGIAQHSVQSSEPWPGKAADSFVSYESQYTAPLSFSSLSSSSTSDTDMKLKSLKYAHTAAAVGGMVHIALADDTGLSESRVQLTVTDYRQKSPLKSIPKASTSSSAGSSSAQGPWHIDQPLASVSTPKEMDSPVRGYPLQGLPWQSEMFELVQSTPVMETSSSSSSATESFLQAIAPLSPLRRREITQDPTSTHVADVAVDTVGSSHMCDGLRPPASPISEVSTSTDSMADVTLHSRTQAEAPSPGELTVSAKAPTAFTVNLDDHHSSPGSSTSMSSTSLQTSFKQRKQHFMKSSAERLASIKQHSAKKASMAGRRRFSDPVQKEKSTTGSSARGPKAGPGSDPPLPSDKHVHFASPLQEFFSSSQGLPSNHRSQVGPEEMRARTKRLVAGLDETRRRDEEARKKEEAQARQQRVQQLQKKIYANRAKKAASIGQPRLHAHPLPPRRLQDKTISNKPWK